MGGSQNSEFTVEDAKLTLHVSGAARLQALIGLIDGAQHSLNLLYYIFVEDNVGRQVRDALVRALERGVSVDLIVDGFGASASDAFFQPLEDRGGVVCRFIPRIGRRFLLRNHQKLALADGRRALVGGFNIEDAYFDDSGPEHWRDLGVEVEGDAVRWLAGYFEALLQWTHTPKARMRDLRRSLRRWSEPEGKVRWLMGGPMRRLNPWVRQLKRDLRVARRADIISAYFVPHPTMLRRIAVVGQRGEANLMTAARSDQDISIGAARHSYALLLKRGVNIWEYQAAKLHTKLVIIDDAVYLGSANFDIRSQFINLEVMLRVEDPDFARYMRRYAEMEREQSERITPALHRQRGTWLARLRWGVAYFVLGVLDLAVSRRLNFPSGWR